jgi:predicted DNA-binding protein YlxM (UPF0122 family)
LRGQVIAEDFLRRLYLDEGLAPRAIGQRLGLSETAIRKRLLALDIPLRSRAEAQRARVAGLTIATLTQLYTVDGLSQVQIADRLHCSVDAVHDAMRRYQLPVRSPSASARLAHGVNIPEAELRHLYEEEALGMRAIAQRFACSESAVRSRIKACGIAPRKPWTTREVTIGAVELHRLYVIEDQTVEAIAAQLGCSPATISRQIKRFGISARPSRVPVYPRANFSGDLAEKAYLVGFRLGDLAVFEEGASIVVSTSTTKSEQATLLAELFEPYGHTYVFQNPVGRKDFTCRLNATFDFLVPKADAVPAWAVRSDELFAAFLAGYIDAEGSFQAEPRLCIRTYDVNILRTAWERFARWDIRCPVPRVVTRAGYSNKAGIVSRKDLWDLTVRRKTSLEPLIKRLLPFMKHAKRCRDARQVLDILHNKNKSKANS